MSVILGKLNFQSSIEKAELDQMLGESNHFSADSTGKWCEQNCGIGTLKIINTPESVLEQLPYYSSEFQLVITADARIDNRVDLCKKLEIKNPTLPDSQLILLAYKKYGKACVKQLIGAFAFAIWDIQKQELFCARDQIGVRPFFYYKDSRFFAFASEKRGILAIPTLDKSIRHEYVVNQLITVVNALETTFYTHIYRLKPAHTLTVTANGKVTAARYWDLDAQKSISFKKEEDYIEAFLEKMKEAVNCRLRTTKRVGVEMSGGLDSTGVAAIAQPLLQQKQENLHCFSMVMPKEQVGKAYPYEEGTAIKEEGDLIDEFCEMAGIDHQFRFRIETEFEEGLSYTDFLDRSLNFSSGLDDRMGPSYHVLRAEAAKQEVATMLVGFPGDELVTSLCHYEFLEYLAQRKFANFIKTGKKQHTPATLGAYWGLRELHAIAPKLARFIEKTASTLRFDEKIKQKKLEDFKKRGFLSPEVLNTHPNLADKIQRVEFEPRALSLKEAQKTHILRGNTC